MKANAFANGHMKKNAAYFSLQHQRSTIRKQSTACISYVEKSTPKKDQLHHVINEFGMNICNAIGQWKIENVLNNTAAEPLMRIVEHVKSEPKK